MLIVRDEFKKYMVENPKIKEGLMKGKALLRDGQTILYSLILICHIFSTALAVLFCLCRKFVMTERNRHMSYKG